MEYIDLKINKNYMVGESVFWVEGNHLVRGVIMQTIVSFYDKKIDETDVVLIVKYYSRNQKKNVTRKINAKNCSPSIKENLKNIEDFFHQSYEDCFREELDKE